MNYLWFLKYKKKINRMKLKNTCFCLILLISYQRLEIPIKSFKKMKIFRIFIHNNLYIIYIYIYTYLYLIYTIYVYVYLYQAEENFIDFSL